MTRPLQALVVDDEQPAREYLIELLLGTGLVQVAGAVASADEAREALATAGGIDVAFLDIRLSGARNEGLEIARSLAADATSPMVVLATAFNAHALEGYELGVTDYLLKPLTEERVALCVQRLVTRRPEPAVGLTRIVARRQKSLVFLAHNEVWAFEAADRLARVHSARGVFDVDLSLAAIEASLGRAFVRVHRNWLLRVEHIQEFERSTETRVWVGEGLASGGRGLHVPVARDRAQSLRDLLLSSATGLRRAT